MTDDDMIPRSEALAMVAAAYEDAAKARGLWLGFNSYGEPNGDYCTVEAHDPGGMRLYISAEDIRSRTPADALAALDRVREEEQAKFLAGDWDDRDDDMTAAIRADFHERSDGDFYARYARAMELVGNRKSKGSLVALVCFLLRATPDTQEGEG